MDSAGVNSVFRATGNVAETQSNLSIPTSAPK